jgi:hypothetical protein
MYLEHTTHRPERQRSHMGVLARKIATNCESSETPILPSVASGGRSPVQLTSLPKSDSEVRPGRVL